MKKYECKCGSKDIFIKDSGNNKGLYCADCGKWMKWLNKDELRLAERQIEQQNMCESCIHKVRADAIDEELQKFAQWLWDANYLVDEAFTIKLVEQFKTEQLKQQN